MDLLQHEPLIHSIVRLPIALSVWILAGELPATRTGYHKNPRGPTGNPSKYGPADRILASRLPMMDSLIASSENQLNAIRAPLLDLDGFKEINDAFGHATGDPLLIVVSQRIRSLVRSSDLVARLGGDEFAIYLNNCPFATALSVGEAIRRSILEPIALERGSVNVSASVGLVSLDDYASAEDALTRCRRCHVRSKSSLERATSPSSRRICKSDVLTDSSVRSSFGRPLIIISSRSTTNRP